MSTIFTNLFSINGAIDTGKNVLSNINDLCTSAGCWLSYDVTTGLWSVVINRAGNSVFSFNDTNIIGAINVSGSGINEAYNKVTVEFPHKDLQDTTDYIDLIIDPADRFPNELDNTLNLNLQLVNEAVQAQYVAAIELKQSRLDRIVEFRTDYTALGIRAGEIIDITSTVYGFTSKKFRVNKIIELDGDDGSIQLSITAQEYSDAIYNTDGLFRQERNKKTGIIPKAKNSILKQIDADAAAGDLGAAGVPIYSFQVLGATSTFVQEQYRLYAGTPTSSGAGNIPLGFAGDTSKAVGVSFNFPGGATVAEISCLSPFGNFDYKAIKLNPGSALSGTGAATVDFNVDTQTDLAAYFPSQYSLQRLKADGTWENLDSTTSDWQTQNVKFYLQNVQPNEAYRITIQPIQTYDLNNFYVPYVFPYNFTVSPQSTGYGFSIFVNIFKTRIQEATP